MPINSPDNSKPIVQRVEDLSEGDRKLMEAGLLFAAPTPEQRVKSEIIRALSLNKDSQDQQTRLQRLIEKVSGLEDKGAAEIFISSVGSYAYHQGIDDDAEIGFEQKLLPAILKRDPQIAVLIRGVNTAGYRRGEYGVSDFLGRCFASKVDPENINLLMMALGDIPTTDVGRFDQNREDVFGVSMSLRELVHDQRPYVHELIGAMINFYETGDKEYLEGVMLQDRRFEKGEHSLQFSYLEEEIYDRGFYEKLRLDNDYAKTDEKVIDVLRRMKKNTEPVDESPPDTADEELNKMLVRLKEGSGAKGPNKDLLKSAIDRVSGKLMAMMDAGEIGIEPNFVLALSWLSRRCFKVLQTLTFEEQVGVFKEPWFISILKFQEFLNSTHKFDENNFRQFVEDIGKMDYQRAYKAISERVLNNVAVLARKYKARGREDWVGALWSGNTTHELAGLVDLKPADTVFGVRKRIEEVKQPWDRKTGD